MYCYALNQTRRRSGQERAGAGRHARVGKVLESRAGAVELAGCLRTGPLCSAPTRSNHVKTIVLSCASVVAVARSERTTCGAHWYGRHNSTMVAVLLADSSVRYTVDWSAIAPTVRRIRFTDDGHVD